MDYDHQIDARGLRCPLPVLRAAKALRDMAPGQLLWLRADDPMAAIDVPHFCKEAGHVLLTQTDDSDHQTYLIRRGSTATSESQSS